MQKIKTVGQVKEDIEDSRKQGKKTALITGCFDILHHGHLSYFEFAKGKADILVVAIDSDASIKDSKGKERPVFKQMERAKMLAALSLVDYVIMIKEHVRFDDEDADKFYEELISNINPDMIVTNSRKDNYWRNKKERAERLGIECLVQETADDISTTKIIELLNEEF